jgi:hypothetical protein
MKKGFPLGPIIRFKSISARRSLIALRAMPSRAFFQIRVILVPCTFKGWENPL